MPGFVINGQGGGQETQNPSASDFGAGDPHRAYRWALKSLGSIIIDELMPVYEMNVPAETLQVLEIKGVSQVYKFAKSIVFEDCNVTFYDVGQMHTIMHGWRNLVWSDNDGLQKEYKKIVEFMLLGNEGENVRGYKLHNAWPKKIGHSQLSMSTNEFKLLTVTFAFDWIEVS